MIRIKQIDGSELYAYVVAASSGSLSVALIAYLSASGGYVGNSVVYITGTQLISGQKTFDINPIVNYTGNLNSVINKQYFLDTLTGSLINLSGVFTGGFVQIQGNQSIFDRKIFTGALGVGTPIQGVDAINLNFLSLVSGVLSSGMGGGAGGNFVDTASNGQIISGQKIFNVNPLVATPSAPSGAANKAYVDAISPTGVMHLTGNETATGIKTFLQSPLVPVATLPNQAISKMQLDALGTTIGGISGFAGVASINGSTGAASGAVYLIGAGNVSVQQCGAIFYVSGITDYNTFMYGAEIPLPSGITGLSFAFPTGLNFKPTITDSLEITGGNAGYFDYVLYNVTTGGFKVSFQSGIPNNNYIYNFHAVPIGNGSGFAALQGTIGPSGLVGPPGTGVAGPTGAVGFFVNSGIITGNFVNISFFSDPVATGFNLFETFVSRNFTFTGAAFSCRTSGFGQVNGGILTGKLYQVDFNNTEQTLFSFTFNSGLIYSGSPLFTTAVTGYNRVGLSITNSLSGIEKFCVGIFGF